MATTLIKNATIVNEGKIFQSDLYLQNGIIQEISENIDRTAEQVVDATGKHLIAGVIDDQVHFKEPGLTHKAEIYTEAKAAVAGGITSFMEMPNTKPQSLTQELLEKSLKELHKFLWQTLLFLWVHPMITWMRF